MFLFCLFVCLFVLLSRSHLEAVLSKFKILSCTNNKKNGKTGDSEADRSSSKLHKSHKNGPNSPKLPSKDLSIICLSLLCFWSLGFHQKRSRSAYIFPSELSVSRCVWPGTWTWRDQRSLKAYVRAAICLHQGVGSLERPLITSRLGARSYTSRERKLWRKKFKIKRFASGFGEIWDSGSIEGKDKLSI